MSTIAKLREPKFLDMAIFDWVATASVAAAIGLVRWDACLGVMMFIILVLIGIVVHVAFNIPTMFNAYLGLAKKEDVYKARAKA